MCFGGGGVDSGAYQQAANIQSQGSQNAINALMGMYNQARADVGPWRDAGQAAQPYLAALYGIPGYGYNTETGQFGTGEGFGGAVPANLLNERLEQWPGYQWMQRQALGDKGYTGALDRAAGARGMALSGAQRAGITNYAQQQGLTYALQPYLSGVTGISNQGLQAGGMSGNWAMQAGNQIAGLTQAGAQAQAAGLVNAANANAANSGGSDWMSALGMIGGLAGSLYGGGGLGSMMGGLGGMFGGGAGAGAVGAAGSAMTNGGWMSNMGNFSAGIPA